MIIGIHGKARSGKDTAADFLVEQHGFAKFSFADPMKDILMDAFQWERRHLYGGLKDTVDPKWGFTPRAAMQLFGTEFGRRLNPNLWLIFASDAIDVFSNQNQDTVIPDVRFDNEAEFVRQRGGVVWHLERSNSESIFGIEEHASEVGIQFADGDIRIANDGSIDHLYLKIREIMSH